MLCPDNYDPGRVQHLVDGVACYNIDYYPSVAYFAANLHWPLGVSVADAFQELNRLHKKIMSNWTRTDSDAYIALQKRLLRHLRLRLDFLNSLSPPSEDFEAWDQRVGAFLTEQDQTFDTQTTQVATVAWNQLFLNQKQ